MVRKKAHLNKLHRATVIRASEDAVTIQYDKDQLFETLPVANVEKTASAKGNELYHAQFEGMTPEQRKQTKTDSRAFDDLLRNEGHRFGWYDPVAIYAKEHGTQNERIDEQRMFKAAVEAALKEFGMANEDWRSSIARARALPMLRAKLAPFMQVEKQAEEFARATDAGPVTAPIEELQVGDVLDIEGERTEVIARDPQTGVVTLKDGTRFGTQVLEDGGHLMVEAWIQPEATGSADFAPADDPFALDSAESVEEQKARAAADAAKRQAETAKANMLTKAGAALTGSAGDLGQGDLLGGPTDLFAPPAPKPTPAPKPFGSENKLVSTARAEELKRMIREKLGRTSAGIDPTLLANLTELGAYYLEAGIHAFPAWSAQMIEDFGDHVRPWLRSVYEGARAYPGASYEDNMTAPDAVKKLAKDYANGATPHLERTGGGTDSPAPQPGEGNIQPEVEGSGVRGDEPVLPESNAGRGGLTNPVSSDGDIPDAPSQPGDSGVSPERQDTELSGAKPGERGGRTGSGGPDGTRTSVESQSNLGTPGSPKIAPDSPSLADGPELSPEERLAAQRAAEGAVAWQPGDAANIAASLPVLYPAQQEDVLKAERRFFLEHPSEPANASAAGLGDPKRGILFTNGTGTGKTFTGAGIVKRFTMQGKNNILIAAPHDGVINEWMLAAPKLGLEIKLLEDTTKAGEGIVITTYANMRSNDALLKRDFDLVVMDECDNLLSNEAGEFTAGIQQFRRLANHPFQVRWKVGRRIVGPQPNREDFNTQEAYNEAAGNWLAAVDRNKPRIDAEEARLRDLNTRAVFLSATPFAYHKNVQLVDGYLYTLPDDTNRTGYNTPRGFDRLLVESFGYRMRTGRLNKPDAAVRVDLMEMAFNEALQKKGAISGRIIDVPTDYSREFVAINSDLGLAIDAGFSYFDETETYRRFKNLTKVVMGFWDYNQKAQLLEALKIAEAIPRIREHIALGRKVILFHTYLKSGTRVHPFRIDTYPADILWTVNREQLATEYAEFAAAFPHWVNLEMPSTANSMARIEAAFGDAVRFYNGTVPTRKRAENKVDFQKDDSPVKLMVAQLQAGKAGMSLHDVTGKFQRVVMQAALPTRPTDSIQAEGRAYRIGVLTNAIYEYLVMLTNTERFQFGSRINEKTGTAENLAMGNLARTLRDNFRNGYLSPTDSPPSPQQGVGGKLADRRAATATDFERAIAFYFGRLRKNSRTKSAEGVDYFATPEPLGLKMVEWARPRTGEDILEPSAGHGAIGRWFPETTSRTYVEPSVELRSELGIIASGGRIVGGQFEDLDIVNKYDVIVMNPPFGQGGSKAIQHLAKAAWSHLRDGGRIVALIPEGPAADAKFEKFIEDPRSAKLYVRRVIGLPNSVFERAGTSVLTRIVIIDRSDTTPLDSQGRIDFNRYPDINEFFEAIKNADSIERPVPAVNVAAQNFIAGGRSAILPSVPALVPVRDQAPSATPAPGPRLIEPAQTIHAIKKIPLYVAKTTKRVSSSEYTRINSIAKRHGGYWSSFAKNGAIPGFQFESARERDAFMLEINGPETPPAPSASEVAAAAATLTTPEAAASANLDPAASPATQAAAEQKANEADVRLGGIRPGLNPNAGQSGAILNPAQLLADLLVAGARVLRRGLAAGMTKGQWTAAMLKRYGQSIANKLNATWTRLARLTNQIANGVSAITQGHLNQIESLAGNTNIPEEEKPLYSADTLAKGTPALLTRLAPVSTQIRILGSETLAAERRKLHVTEATQAAAVKAQSDNLWRQLVSNAAAANPLARWRLPNWITGTPRARKFKERALHIAARLNVTGRDANGNFTFADFTMRAGSMSTGTAKLSKLSVGDTFVSTDPLTGAQDTLTLGPIIQTPEGRVFHQLFRAVDAKTQRELYQHYAAAYPELIWFLDMFIDPALANTRQTINGIEVPVFNRFAAAAMMADGNPSFTPLAAYTPDVLITRSLLGTIRSALSFRAGTRSAGRKYKSGTSREGGHVRDLLSGFNVRTWQMLAEQGRREWMRAVLATATPIKKNSIPAGWTKLETGMDDLWQAVKRLRNWQSPENWRPLKQSEIDDMDVLEEKLGPNERIVQKDGRFYLATKLFPETEARLTERGEVNDYEERDFKKFFGEVASLRGRQLMLPTALVDQIIRRHVAQVQHGILYRLGAWAVRNSARLYLVAPTTYVANVLTNDLFTLEAATRRVLSGIAGRNGRDLRFARELFRAEAWKWFPGIRQMVDPEFRNTVAEVLPDNIFADQTMLADLKVRMDEDPTSSLRRGEIGATALQAIAYGNIDVRSKQRMAFAWLRATAITNAKRAGLRGPALRSSVERYMQNPPVADRATAIEIAGFELLNYTDSPAWLETVAGNDWSKLLLPFPRFGYHYIAKNAKRAAAVRDLVSKAPKGSRADALADVLTFLAFPAGGLGIAAAYAMKALGAGGDDDDEARKLVGTSFTTTTDKDGNLVKKPISRELITSNRINLSAWARQLGIDTGSGDDFWLRVRNYPVIAMAGAAILAEEDARKFGAAEGAKSYAQALGDLSSDFFSVGMALKVPSKVYQSVFGKPWERMTFDPYGGQVPLVAYVIDQTLDSMVPGTRQADIVIKWLDPVQRRRTASKTLGFEPTAWDAARVGHVSGILDRLFTGSPGDYGSFESTLPPEGRPGTGNRIVKPQTYPVEQRLAEILGFNIRPVDRRAYENAISK